MSDAGAASWPLQARVALQGLDEAAAEADASATHTRIAERMRDLALEQGGIYVKGGQHICAQPIIPHECVFVCRSRAVPASAVAALTLTLWR